MTGENLPKFDPANAGPSEDMAWGIVSTLVAGPIVWGGVGALVDNVVNTSRVFLPLGVVVGFIVSFYIVYVRFGKNTELEQGDK
jgi:ATP synthase protein I